MAKARYLSTTQYMQVMLLDLQRTVWYDVQQVVTHHGHELSGPVKTVCRISASIVVLWRLSCAIVTLFAIQGLGVTVLLGASASRRNVHE